jgi:hypothetical protein
VLHTYTVTTVFLSIQCLSHTDFLYSLWISFKPTFMRCYQKVPGLGQKRNAGLIYTILAAISFKSFLGNIYNDPIVFSTLQKAPWKSLSLMLSGTTCDSLWMSRRCFKTSLHLHFQFGKQSENTGAKSGE